MGEELAFKDEAAGEYDRAFAHVTAHFMPFLLRAARVAPGMHVLDIATGTGLSAEAALAAVGPSGQVEAMACGTPVIAYRSGSVPEVIDDGLTGFIVESEEEAVDAVNRLARLDRRKVRKRFEERFSAHRMARAYESHYRQLVDGGALWETTE